MKCEPNTSTVQDQVSSTTRNYFYDPIDLIKIK